MYFEGICYEQAISSATYLCSHLTGAPPPTTSQLSPHRSPIHSSQE